MEAVVPATVRSYEATKRYQQTRSPNLETCIRIIKERESYLSPGIAQLVVSDPVAQFVIDSDGCFSSSNLSINWTKFSRGSVCPELKTIEEATPYVSKFIRAACKNVHRAWNCLSKEHISDLFSQHKEYLAVPELMPRFLELYEAKEFALCFQMACSWIERSIGDILASQMKDASTLPWKLNDLLLIERLEKLISADAVFVLKCTLGRMDGLNMRNLLWHGFISEWEFDGAYTTFLFSVLLSLARMQKEKIQHRPLWDLRSYHTAVSLEELTSTTKELCDKRSIGDITALLDRSFFVVPGRETIWLKALEDYRSQRFYEAALRLFPQLEHSVRRVFVSCNGKYQQLLTADLLYILSPLFIHFFLDAETQELYTTIDVLLARTVRDTTQRNQIFHELGYGISNALLDLFIWDESNRLRDALGHGGVSPANISTHEVEFLILLSFALLVKYDLRNDRGQEYFDVLASPLRKCYSLIVNRYTPTYHPRAKLRAELIPAAESLVALQKLLYALPEPPQKNSNASISEVPPSSPVSATEDFKALLSFYNEMVSRAESIVTNQCIQSRFSRVMNLSTATQKAINPDCRPRELTKLAILRKLAVQSNQIAVEFLQKVQSLGQAVADRSAWKRHREQFDVVRTYRDLFVAVMRLIGLLVEIAESSGEEDDATDWPLQWWNFSGALLSSVTKSSWKKAVAICAAAGGIRHTPVESILSVKETTAGGGKKQKVNSLR